MLLVILLSMIVGGLCTIVFQIIMFYSYVRNQPLIGTGKPRYERAQMPKELGKYQDVVAKRESLHCLNFVLAFLFGELKDTERVRRWIVKKMNVEFDELLQTKTLGRVIEALTVREYSLGTALPIFKNATLLKAKPSDMEQVPEELDISLEVEYSGGFRLAVDADLVFGRTAFVSITLKHLQGKGRLQLTRHPYTHWSFAFYTEPEMEFEVESQFEGRIVSQLGSLIVNQIRRSIRKKHTLPNYKIRYKPFFIKPDPPHLIDDILVNDIKVSIGRLQVTVVECTRLPTLPTESEIFCTLAVDSSPYKQRRSGSKPMRIPYYTVEVEIKRNNQAQPLGTSFRQSMTADETDEVVILDAVTQNSPASSTDLKKGDVLVSVDGGKVMSVKHAAKLVKQAGEKVMMKVRRPVGALPDDGSLSDLTQSQTVYAEESVTLKADSVARLQDSKDDDDFVNITIKKVDSNSSVDSQAVASATLPAAVLDVDDGSAKQKATSSPMLIRRKLQTAVGVGVRAFSGKGDDSKAGDVGKAVKNGGVKTDDAEVVKESKGKSSLEAPRDGGKEATCRKDSEQSKQDASLHVTDSSGSLSRRGSGQSMKDGQTEVDSGDLASDSASLLTKFEDLYDIETKRTSNIPALLDPAWDETFQFDVYDSDQYLHVCVWCKGFIAGKPHKETLISYTNIPLMNIALQCLTTASGEYLQTFHLQPPERRAGSSRRGLHPELSAHRGFEESLCYGDVTLLFHHKPDPTMHNLTRDDVHIDVKRQAEPATLPAEPDTKPTKTTTSAVPAPSKKVEEAIPKKIPVSVEKESERMANSVQSAEISKANSHIWVGTQFHSPTRCDFCSKKVWTKYAFRCNVCSMICHKKCQEKAQIHTYCTKEGARRSSTSMPLTETNKPIKDDANIKAGVSTQSPKSSPKLLARSLHLTSKLPLGYRISGGKAATIQDGASDNEGSDTDSLAGNARSLKSQLLQSCGPRTKTGDADALVVSAAKEMGKELFSNLELQERKEKLDAMISKLQQEIDQESESRTDLFKEEKQCTDLKEKARLGAQVNKSDERLQALALLMLHYCAGLNDCTEQEEREKLKQAQEAQEDAKTEHPGLDDEDSAKAAPAAHEAQGQPRLEPTSSEEQAETEVTTRDGGEDAKLELATQNEQAQPKLEPTSSEEQVELPEGLVEEEAEREYFPFEEVREDTRGSSGEELSSEEERDLVKMEEVVATEGSREELESGDVRQNDAMEHGLVQDDESTIEVSERSVDGDEEEEGDDNDGADAPGDEDDNEMDYEEEEDDIEENELFVSMRNDDFAKVAMDEDVVDDKESDGDDAVFDQKKEVSSDDNDGEDGDADVVTKDEADAGEFEEMKKL